MAEKQKSAVRAGAKFYITAAIPYVNAPPHLGHAIEYIQCDILARWHRLIGDQTFFLMGADENTLKLIQAAKQEGISPEALADKYAATFLQLIKTLNLSNDSFIRTTDKKNHHPGAIEIWKKLSAAGHIYKGQYEGEYCVGCEQFYTEKEIVDGSCPIHQRPLEHRAEENYLFRLPAFAKQLEKVISDGTYQVLPETRYNEILSFIRGGLADISFSRPADRLTMGVPVPGDPSQTMYVWVDALANYITGIGYGRDQSTFDRWWPADLHIIGKDIIRFHAAIWPAMLLGAGVPLPRRLYAHGFINIEGGKMSKSRGKVVDPFTLVEHRGVDPVRYYLISAMPYAEDGDYSERRFTEVYTAHLANDFGNLVSRVLAIIERQYEDGVPTGTADPKLQEHIGQTHHRVATLFDECRLAEALDAIHDLVVLANRFVDQSQVWNQEGPAKENTLYTLVQVLGHLSLLYEPFIPQTAAKLRNRLGIKEQAWTAATLLAGEKVPPNTKVTKGESLFPKA